MKRRSSVPAGIAMVAGLLLLVSASCGGGGGGIVVVPGVLIAKTANPTSVPETGGNVNYTISITNTGDENITIDSLSDDKFADIAAVCLPAVIAQVLAPAQTANCQFVKNVSGVFGVPHVNVATVNATAASGAPLSDTDDATVAFTNVLQAAFAPDDPLPGGNTLSMQPGASAGASFDVQVRATGVDDLFGVAFHVTFDPAVVSFLGATTTGGILGDPPPQYDVATIAAGEIAVAASLQGGVAGVNNATGLILTLQFQGLAATANSPITFTPVGARFVEICPTAGGACNAGNPTWSAGTVTVN
jgi:hypothetical protein